VHLRGVVLARECVEEAGLAATAGAHESADGATLDVAGDALEHALVLLPQGAAAPVGGREDELVEDDLGPPRGKHGRGGLEVAQRWRVTRGREGARARGGAVRVWRGHPQSVTTRASFVAPTCGFAPGLNMP
jgi:hypothetical protein